MSEERWIIHLPTTAISRKAAFALAVTLRESLGHVTTIDFGETTISEEDRQFLHLRVWCDHLLPTGRCVRRAYHGGECTAR